MGGATTTITGRVAVLVANQGIEEVELTEPWRALQRAGARPELVAPLGGEAQTVRHHEPGAVFPVDRTVANADPSEYIGLVLPGGVANPDELRTHPDAVAFARAFVEAGKPVAAICHGPWTLVEADVVRGRTLTSWPSLKTDIRNAGGTWVDAQVHNDRGLVTSRAPGDLSAFCATMVEELAMASHQG
jgi:protease I